MICKPGLRNEWSVGLFVLCFLWICLVGDPSTVEAIALNSKVFDSAFFSYMEIDFVPSLKSRDLKSSIHRADFSADRRSSQLTQSDFKVISANSECLIANSRAALKAYQDNDLLQAESDLRQLIRFHPMCADGRAILTALLWREGLIGEAQSHWAAVAGLDRRYKDFDWLVNVRGWPLKPSIDLMAFLESEGL